jgi:hypoxanthine-guanine phosphoribosyltransferase
VEFLGLRSYGAGTETSGVVQITYDLTLPSPTSDVLVVEDIVDTGLSMRYLLENLATRQPRSVQALLAAAQALAHAGEGAHRLPGLHHRGPFRGGIRPRLR